MNQGNTDGGKEEILRRASNVVNDRKLEGMQIVLSQNRSVRQTPTIWSDPCLGNFGRAGDLRGGTRWQSSSPTAQPHVEPPLPSALSMRPMSPLRADGTSRYPHLLHLRGVSIGCDRYRRRR